MKVLLDTNVLVAAFATRGLCEDVLRTVLGEHELVVSDQILDELQRILTDKPRMPTGKARVAVEFIRELATVVAPSQPAAWPQRDPDDRWIVAAALEARVDVLVTGDQHLLDSAEQVPVPIVSPRGFWEMLR